MSIAHQFQFIQNLSLPLVTAMFNHILLFYLIASFSSYWNQLINASDVKIIFSLWKPAFYGVLYIFIKAVLKIHASAFTSIKCMQARFLPACFLWMHGKRKQYEIDGNILFYIHCWPLNVLFIKLNSEISILCNRRVTLNLGLLRRD